jgi:methionyl-tRNA synthetase
MKKLITSALPYVNNVPHLGNIIGCVLSADVYARFCRARGYETLYVCGTDEYGTATQIKAKKEGVTPQQVCDKYHQLHKEIYENFNISFNIFGRTSTPMQTKIAQEIFNDLDTNGLISEKTSRRLFCEHDDMFLADRFVEGYCPKCNYDNASGDQCEKCGGLLEPEKLKNPRCTICGNTPEFKNTSHLYLALDSLQDDLEKWAKKAGTDWDWTNNAIQTTKAWFDRGLEPRAITRDLIWGIPVPRPGYEKKVFYVWYDAPIGYITMTANKIEDWKSWWQDPENVELYQFMAKDNIPFHTVIFPACLMGTKKNWTLLHHINATEYLNYEGSKFSKSRNTGIFGSDVKRTQIHIDLWRFYLLANRPERNDSNFSWTDFIEKINSEFINNIGNLVNRTLIFLKNNFNGKIMDPPLPETHKNFIDICKKDFEMILSSFEAVRLRETLRLILAVGNKGNKFFQDMVPWKEIKTNPGHALATVCVLTYLIRNIALVISPYMPETGDKILSILNMNSDGLNDLNKFEGLEGHIIGNVKILYQKLDPGLAEKFKKDFAGE